MSIERGYIMRINYRNLSLVVLMFGFVVILFVYNHNMKRGGAVNFSNGVIVDQTSPLLPSGEYSQTPKQSIKSSVEQKPQEEIFVMGNAAERAKVLKWYVDQGYYGLDDKNQLYVSYDQQTLEKLAASGDLRAMDALAKIFANQATPEGFEAAKQQYWNSAIWGSTFAFVNLGIDNEVRVFGWAKTEEQKRAAALEVLSLYRVGELRGEKWLNGDAISSFKHLQNIMLSASEEKFINDRAQQIYDNLQAERHRLGLGDFNNSVPAEVENFYKRDEQQGKEAEERKLSILEKILNKKGSE